MPRLRSLSGRMIVVDFPVCLGRQSPGDKNNGSRSEDLHLHAVGASAALSVGFVGDIAFIGLGNAVRAVPTRPTGRLSERFFSSITQNKTLYCFHKIKRFIVFIK